MSQNRRDFIKASTAITVLTVSNASAQPSVRTIGIFHSTHISAAEMACFKAGLGSSSNWQATVVNRGEAHGQYGGSHKHEVLRSFIRGPGKTVDVMIAAGGVTAQRSALEELASRPIPLVYMSGRGANPPSSAADGKYCGVILNISAQYENALNTVFNALGIGKSDVLLIQNYNSDFTSGELADWGQNYPSFRLFESSSPTGLDHPDPSNVAAVQAAYDREWARFARIYRKPKGAIVNPDPYFRHTAPIFKTALKSALGDIPVCYPFPDYDPSAPDFLLPNRVTLSSSTSTDSNNAYWQLGARAAAVLNGLSPSHPIPPAKVDSMLWTGSGWAAV